MNSAMEKLSTGFKINSAKDDAAGYAVYTGMEAKVSGYDIINTNAQMGLDMLTTQEGVLDIIGDYLQRIRDLTMQAANGTYGSSSLNAIALEVTQRMDEINRLCKITDFNDTYLLDGSRTSDINLQVGLYSDQRCVVTLDSFLFASAESSMIFGFSSSSNGNMTLDAAAAEDDEHTYEAADGKWYASELAYQLNKDGLVSGDSLDGATLTAICAAIYTNDSTARAFIDNIDDAIDNISLRCTKIGAYMNRLDSAIDSTDVQKANLTEAVSTIKDADAAEESSNYIKYQILQQATASLLATANQQPQIALNLL
jgi:flagellin